MNQSRDVERSDKISLQLGDQDRNLLIPHAVYALYALSTVTGVPALIGFVIALVKRAEYGGSWLESHFTWQIRTFVIMFIASAIAVIMAATFILLPLAWILGGLTWLWFLYRTLKGWLRLSNRRMFRDPYRLF